MNEKLTENTSTTAWLMLMNTPGIGTKRGWKIHQFLHENNLHIADFYSDKIEHRRIPGISSNLINRIKETQGVAIYKREKQLKNKGIAILHPETPDLNLPIEESLSPTLTYWGNTQLLNSSKLVTLLHSRGTSNDTIKRFLKVIAEDKENPVWCFCPFSDREWDLVEALMKAGNDVLLGSISEIPKRAMMLKKDYPNVSLGIFAPEPTPKNRPSQLNQLEACYRFLIKLSRQVLAIGYKVGGKTESRLKWAKKSGYNATIFEYEVDRQNSNELPLRTSKYAAENRKERWESSSDEDEEFISCL